MSRTTLLGGLLALTVPALAVAALEGLHVFQDGQVISAGRINENFSAVDEALDEVQSRLQGLEELQARMELGSRTVAVTDCDGLLAELRSAKEKVFSAGSRITLEVAPGTHVCAALRVDDPSGAHIAIVGAGEGPDETRLVFEGGGPVVERGAQLTIENLTLAGPGLLSDSNDVGLLVEDNATVTARSLFVTDFQDGVTALRSGYLKGDQITASGNLGRGFVAGQGAMMMLSASVADDNGDYGYDVSRGAVLRLFSGATASDNGTAGYRAFDDGLISASEALVGTGNGVLSSPEVGVMEAGGGYIAAPQ